MSTTRKYLSEPEAWRYIADRFFAPRISPITLEGLCSAVEYLAAVQKISDGWDEGDSDNGDTEAVMLSRIDKHLGNKMWAYSTDDQDDRCDKSREAREARGMAALWLALDAEAEGD